MGICGTSGIVLGVQCGWSAGCKKPKAGDEAGKIGGRWTFERISNYYQVSRKKIPNHIHF